MSAAELTCTYVLAISRYGIETVSLHIVSNNKWFITARSYGKVMFLHLSVILFTGAGGSLSKGGLSPGVSLSGRPLVR